MDGANSRRLPVSSADTGAHAGRVHSGITIQPPVCIRRASGAYLEDLDGNKYIDYHGAFGAIILGYAHPVVDEAVASRLRDGVLYGVGTTEAEAALARRITELVPSVESVLLTTSGTEATFHAIRLARAVTQRKLIVKCQGSYHGSHDYVLRNVLSPPRADRQAGPGLGWDASCAIDSTLVCRFNDKQDVTETFAAHGDQIAAVIVEPILHNAPSVLPKRGYLEHQSSLCRDWGALLIFDELITGFRHSIGGYQAIAGVTPDLTTMGKALGNGYPIAALGGRRVIMERFSTAEGGDVFYAGTYNGNQVGVAAALATLAELETSDVYEHIFALESACAKVCELTKDVDVPTVVTGYGSIYTLAFPGAAREFEFYDDVASSNYEMQVRYRREMIRRGVFEMPDRSGRNHVSLAHTRDDIDRTLEIAEEALRAIRHNSQSTRRNW